MCQLFDQAIEPNCFAAISINCFISKSNFKSSQSIRKHQEMCQEILQSRIWIYSILIDRYLNFNLNSTPWNFWPIVYQVQYLTLKIIYKEKKFWKKSKIRPRLDRTGYKKKDKKMKKQTKNNWKQWKGIEKKWKRIKRIENHLKKKNEKEFV